MTAEFEDGTSATGTLVVGADGTHSTTRHVIFDNDKVADASLVPYNAINLHVCYNDVDKAKHVRQGHPIMYHAIHPKGYWLFTAIQDVPDPEKPETWVYQLQCTWKKTFAAGRKRTTPRYAKAVPTKSWVSSYLPKWLEINIGLQIAIIHNMRKVEFQSSCNHFSYLPYNMASSDREIER